MTKVINGFVWLIVTDKAKEIYSSGTFELYALYPDPEGTESLIECESDIEDALEDGLDIGIEVGRLEGLVDANYKALSDEFEQYKKESVKWSIEDFTEYDHDTYRINAEQAQEALERMIYKHDADMGISWQTVEHYLTEYGTLKTNNHAL